MKIRKTTNEDRARPDETPAGDESPVGSSSGSRWRRQGRSHAIFEFEDSYGAHPSVRRVQTTDASSPTPGVREEGGAMADDDPIDADTLFETAKTAAAQGSVAQAIRAYRRLVSADPSHLRARNNLGVLLDRSGDHDAAVDHFRAAMELDPENPEVMTNLGAALASSGRFDEAEERLRRAARLDPGGLDVRANLGILFFRKGLYAQAEQELRWVCEQDGEHALAHFYRGEALNRLGRIDEAMEVLERSARLEPNRSRVYYLLGILYDRKNLRQEAAVMYRKARELNEP